MKKLRNNLAGISASATFLLSLSAAQGATITWGPAITISGDSDVSMNGDSVFAFSLGNSGSTDVVNGTSFVGINVASEGAGFSDANLTVSDLGSNGTTTYAGNAGNALSALSANYRDILQSGSFVGGGLDSFTITLNDLVVGDAYEVQFWVNDARNRPDQETVPRSTTIVGPDILVDYNVAGNNTDAGVGQFAIGTFTADAISQDFVLLSGAHQLNAIQLRAIPEPSSAILVALGGLGLISRRRRS